MWRIAAGFIAALAAFAPVTLPTGSEPDRTLHVAMHEAWRHGWVFGRDLRLTFGPWGFLFHGYAPQTAAVAWIAAVLLAMAFAVGARALDDALFPIAACGLMLFGAPDVRFFAILILLLLLLIRGDDSAATPVVAAAAGLISLVKLSFFIAALVVIVPLIRRRPSIAASFAGTFLLGWLVARQPLSALPHFFVIGADVVRGYSAGVAFAPREWLPVVAIVVGAIGLAVMTAWRDRRADAAVATALLAFVLCKSVLTRADDSHVIAGAASLFILAIGILAIRQIRAARVIVVATEVAIIALTLPLYAKRFVRIGRNDVASEYATFIRDIRHRDLPPMPGSVDAIPYGGAALVADGVQWVPRPALESYMAWTPQLARDDLGHLTQNWLFVSVAPVDEHLPSSEDPLLWPAILTRYDFVRMSGSEAILQRRTTTIGMQWVAMSFTTAAAGEWCTVDDGGDWLQCKIDVDIGLADRINGILVRPQLIDLDVKTADGATQHYTIVPALAREGFLLSPLFRSTGELVSLLRSEPLSGRRVVAIRSDRAMRLSIWRWRVGSRCRISRTTEDPFSRR